MERPIVLLVDDEERALFGLGHILRADGYRLRFAPGAAEALRVLAAERVAAVVTDLRMPGVDGLQLLEAVRREHPGVARLVLTGTWDPAQEAEVRRTGLAHAFLHKPCDRLEVQATVRAAVELTLEVEALFEQAGRRR